MASPRVLVIGGGLAGLSATMRLAELGIDTIDGALFDLGVNSAVADDPAKFAASRAGIGTDTGNLTEGADGNARLANFLDRALDSQDGSSLLLLYDRMVSRTTQGATVARATAERAIVNTAMLIVRELAVVHAVDCYQTGLNRQQTFVVLFPFFHTRIGSAC